MKKETSVYKVRGSHRTEQQIKILLEHDPDIHSGYAGQGAFCVVVTSKEYELLNKHGFKISKKKIR